MSEQPREGGEEQYDESEQIKTVFACAGSVLNQAQVLELAIQTLLVLAGSISGAVTSLEAYDQFEEKLRTHSLGQLIHKVRKNVKLDAKTEEIIGRALERRNFLAHHFFREREVEILGQKGRSSMIEELLSCEDLFIQATAIVTAIVRAIGAPLRITETKIQAEFEKMAKRAE